MQDGTPSPDYPVDVVGCGEQTENLLNYTTAASGPYTTVTQISGGISVSGSYYAQFKPVQFVVGRTYTMSWKADTISGTSVTGWRFQYAGNTYSSLVSSGSTLTVAKEVTQLLLYVSTGEKCVVEFTEIMLNEGNTALPYEPYGYKLPPTVNGTEYPIYLGQVSTTRRIKKLVLTGKENIVKAASNPVFTMQLGPATGGVPISENAITTLSTHYRAQNNTADTGNVGDMRVCIRRGYSTLYIGDTRYDNEVDFKSYLAAQYAAGTPVTVWYILATPETGTVNEPLMKIGDYADTISFAQAGVTIPTVSGANVLDMTSTVKPSEVYIKGSIKPTGYG